MRKNEKKTSKCNNITKSIQPNRRVTTAAVASGIVLNIWVFVNKISHAKNTWEKLCKWFERFTLLFARCCIFFLFSHYLNAITMYCIMRSAHHGLSVYSTYPKQHEKCYVFILQSLNMFVHLFNTNTFTVLHAKLHRICLCCPYRMLRCLSLVNIIASNTLGHFLWYTLNKMKSRIGKKWSLCINS